MNVLLTGATGFVGRSLAKRMELLPDLHLGIALRTPQKNLGVSQQYLIDGLSAMTNWSSAVAGREVVIHAAARVCAIETESDPLAAFRGVNVDGTLNLARQAALAGVKRFIFISSVKVNGERTMADVPFKHGDLPCPKDAYGISKHEAEMGLRRIAHETGLEVVIVRPPLVYGPGVKGNFSTMLRWLKRGWALPLGAVTENRRSLVALDNLVDLLMTCIDHPAAANETFLVSDGVDLSTTDLLCRLASAMDKPARLLPIPPLLLQAAATLLGKSDMAQRLLGNLQVDVSHTCETLGWKPLISVNEGLRRTVQGLGK